MAASYPESLPSFTQKQDQIDLNYAAHINRLQDEVRAVTVELGTNPRGVAADVKTRLDNLDTMKSATDHTHHSTYWQRALVTSKGELLVGTGPGNVAPLAPAANRRVLVTDDTTPTGLRWAALTTLSQDVVAATTPGSIVGRMQVFDATGNPAGFIPVYDTIT